MFNSNLCVICKESITDPVCDKCYIEQTTVLLNDLRVNPRIIDFIKDKLENRIHLETLNDSECILCQKEHVDLCRYCFSVVLIRTLREINFPEDLIETFEDFFSLGNPQIL